MTIFEENVKLKMEMKSLKIKYDSLFHENKALNIYFNKKVENEIIIKTKTLTDKITELEKLLTETITDKDAQIDALKKEMAKMASILNNNSSNSGIPTSQTKIGEKKRIPNTRETTSNSRGGQIGHPRSILKKFNDDEITEIENHIPSSCPNCGSHDLEVLETYTEKHETDYEVVVIKKAHRFNNCRCKKCDEEFREDIPNSLKEENQYGFGVQSLAICLTNETFTPINKVSKLISGITDNEINPSEGFISKLQTKANKLLENFDEELKSYFPSQHTYYWDDTCVGIDDNDNGIMRTYCTDDVTLYRAHKSKSEKTLDEDGILLATPSTTTVVHDHLTHNYNPKYSFKNSECFRHLISRLIKMMENITRKDEKTKEEITHKWLQQLINLLREANNKRAELLAQGGKQFDKNYLNELTCKYDKILKLGYEENDEDTNNIFFDKELSFLRDLEKYKDGYLCWCFDLRIHPTNNISERSNRPIKSKQKVSGHFVNLESARKFARIRSYIATCKKNGINIITACISMMKGKPFTLNEVLNHNIKNKPSS